MALPTITEKLQLSNEKNILIQGLPSSIEKHFSKLSFAKNVTPLLKSRKIEFALIFAVSIKQLTDILNDVVPALNDDARLWVSYPKTTSKIASDLCRQEYWPAIDQHRLTADEKIELDSVWCATCYKLPSKVKKSVPRLSRTKVELEMAV
jgi:hypothetical protein